MSFVSRRRFLGSAAAVGALPGMLAAQQDQQPQAKPAEKKKKDAPLLPPPVVSPELGPDTLFLTWRRDPTTTSLVQWIASGSAAEQQVSVSPVGKNQWRSVAAKGRPYPKSSWTAFRAEITGLAPATEYELRVGETMKPRRFRTMPAKLTDSFQFVTGGDCGIDEHAVANNRIAARQDPWFAVVGGDLAYDNGRRADVSVQYYRNWSATMVDGHGRMIPMVAGIGNHEVDGGYGKPREAATFFIALHDGLHSERTYSVLDFGDYLSLILLDTGHVAPIGGEQASWLEGVLRERKDRPHVIPVNHVPAYPSFRMFEAGPDKEGTGEGNRKHWLPLFEKYDVSLVLEHHDHTFKRTHPMLGGRPDPNGILFLGDGSWGMLRAPKSPEQRPYLAAVAKEYHLTLHRIEGEQRFHIALAESGRILDVRTTGRRLSRRRVG